MTLNKNRMVREIGRRTRLKNREVQLMLETLLDVWMEELVAGGRIELENFFVLESQVVDRGKNSGTLLKLGQSVKAPRYITRINVRISKKLKRQLGDDL